MPEPLDDEQLDAIRTATSLAESDVEYAVDPMNVTFAWNALAFLLADRDYWRARALIAELEAAVGEHDAE